MSTRPHGTRIIKNSCLVDIKGLKLVDKVANTQDGSHLHSLHLLHSPR